MGMQDNIKINVYEIEWEVKNLIYLAQGQEQVAQLRHHSAGLSVPLPYKKRLAKPP